MKEEKGDQVEGDRLEVFSEGNLQTYNVKRIEEVRRDGRDNVVVVLCEIMSIPSHRITPSQFHQHEPFTAQCSVVHRLDSEDLWG